MTKAAALAAQLRVLDVAKGMLLLEKCSENSLYFDVINDAMCLMHPDGSVNIIENMGEGAVKVEAISPGNVLKALKHYRPFTGLFKSQLQ